MVPTDKPLFTAGTIRVFDDGSYWEWAGTRRRAEDANAEAHVDDLVDVPAKDLAVALRRYRDLVSDVEVRTVTDGDSSDDLEYLMYSPISFALTDNSLVMVIDVFEDKIPDDELPTHAAAQRVAPLLARKRMTLVSDDEELDPAGRFWHTRLTIGFHTRSRTMAQLVHDGLQIVELVTAAANGGLNRQTCGDLIRGGHVNALLGQPESEWLEVKREHYPLRELPAKIRVAQTVAQFANAAAGGLVVIGLATKKVGGVDTINAVTAQPADQNMRRRYVQVLQNHLYPPVEDLRIETVTAEGVTGQGDLLLIDVPAQPEELKPFLVHGAIVDGNAYGSFISVVRRRDDEMVSTTASALHSTLAAGRALLRRGQLPKDSDHRRASAPVARE